jgi:hypothetical protein
VDKYSPHTEDVLEYWTPTVEVVDSEPVFFDLDKAKMDLVNKAVQELGMENAMTLVSDPTALAVGAAQAAAAPVANIAKAASVLPTIPSAATVAAAAAAPPKKGGAAPKRKTRRKARR